MFVSIYILLITPRIFFLSPVNLTNLEICLAQLSEFVHLKNIPKEPKKHIIVL